MDKDSNVFKISGKSIPENTDLFYNPIMDWLFEYFQEPNQTTELLIQLDYYNSSTARSLANILKFLDQKFNEGIDVKIIWAYKEIDETMKENGEDFKVLFSLPFDIKIVK